MKILIIEDDRQFRDMLSWMLETAGYEVETAVDGAEGVKSFAQSPTDLVITDILMPEKEGVETIQELKSSNPNLPSIAISGGSANISSSFGLDLAATVGADRVLRKPFSRGEILLAVQDLMREINIESR